MGGVGNGGGALAAVDAPVAGSRREPGRCVVITLAAAVVLGLVVAGERRPSSPPDRLAAPDRTRCRRPPPRRNHPEHRNSSPDLGDQLKEEVPAPSTYVAMPVGPVRRAVNVASWSGPC
jgi:hypothetical protein